MHMQYVETWSCSAGRIRIAKIEKSGKAKRRAEKGRTKTNQG